MKKYWMGLIALILAVSAGALADVKVKVTGDRVSLRAAPEMNSVLMGRAMSGDELTLKDNTHKEWIGVVPPCGMDVWVSSDYVRGGIVLPARLNLRSGPSLNHSVVGVVEHGDVLTVRGKVNNWLRIAPTEETIVWLSRKYTEIAGAVLKPVTVITVKPTPEPLVAEVTKLVPEPKPEPVVMVEVVKKTNLEPVEPVAEKPEPKPETVQIVKTVVQPEVNEVMVATAQALELPDVLVPDPDKEQGVEEFFSGILQSVEGVVFKLADVDVDQITVCYVRGNVAQLKELEGTPLTMIGKAYWAVGLDQPLIVPVKIQLLSQPQG